MCKSMEAMRDRARAEGADKKAMDMARGLHEQGVDVSIIANAAGVAVEIVMKWLGIQPA